MKKTLFFLLALLFLASVGNVSAQKLAIPNHGVTLDKGSEIPQPLNNDKAGTLHDLTYLVTGTAFAGLGNTTYVAGTNYHCAGNIEYTQSQMKNHVGQTLTKVEVLLAAQPVLPNMSAFKIFLKNTLNGAVVYEQSFTPPTLEAAALTWHTFTLSTPYVITDASLVIGYVATVSPLVNELRPWQIQNVAGSYQVGGMNYQSSTVAGAYGVGASWLSYTAAGNIAIRATVDGNPKFTNDLVGARLIAGARTIPPYVGNALAFNVVTQNQGTAAQTNRDVKLFDASNNELATATVVTSIAAEGYATSALNYTPTAAGFLNVKGQVILTGDQNTANDISAITPFKIWPMLPMNYCAHAAAIGGVGAGPVVSLHGAIYYTAANMTTGTYPGKYLTSIDIGIQEPASVLSNCTVWVRTTLTGANLYSQSFTPTNIGWNTITLATPYLFPAATNTYVGYSYNVNAPGAAYPMGTVTQTQVANGGQLNFSGTWTTLSAAGITGQNWALIGTVQAVAPDVYTITYDGNSSTSGAMTPQPFAAGEANMLQANSFYKIGGGFSGWNTLANGSGTAYTNSQVTTFAANTTLYAQWTALPAYTITFNANGGTGTMAAQTFYQTQSQAITTNTLTKAGDYFTGWNTAANGSGTAYANSVVTTFAANTTLYAQWTLGATITTAVFPIGTGTVNGAGYYPVGGNATLTAVAGPGRGFEKWNDGNTTNPRTITVTANATYTAQFGGLETHTVGTATTLVNYMPFNFYYFSGVAQCLYTEAQMAPFVGKTIHTITYRYGGAGGNSVPRQVEVYIANTTKTSFSTVTDWIPTASFTKVFDGTVQIPASATPRDLLIQLQTPFVYTGGDICVYTNKLMTANDDGSTVTAYATAGVTNRAMYYQSDTKAYDGTDNGTRTTNAPNITFSQVISANNTGAITGTVTYCGAPFEGATVSVEGTPKTGLTNAAGLYTIIDVPAGTYTIKVSKATYPDKLVTGTSITYPVNTTLNIAVLNDYTVTFNANTGTGTMANQTFWHALPQALNANTFTKVDYAFMGWNTTAAGTGTAYTNNQSISLTANLTVYAQWAATFCDPATNLTAVQNNTVNNISWTLPAKGNVQPQVPQTYLPGEVKTTVNPNHTPTLFEAHDGSLPIAKGTARIRLTCGDVWGDGTGYQFLAGTGLYGTVIPATGALTTSCPGSAALYNNFTYKIPLNADGNCSTTNIVFNSSLFIDVPSGPLDYCITNPTPGDRIWIASGALARGQNYNFLDGKEYKFSVAMEGVNDLASLVIADMPSSVTVNVFRNNTQIAINVSGTSYVDNAFETVSCYKVQVNCPASGFSDFSNEVCVDRTNNVTISTAVFPMGAGQVAGGGSYPIGALVTLTPSALIPGCAFEKWSDGNTQNPRTITATVNATYTAQFGESGTGITIGTGTATSTAIPFQFFYNNGAAQTLYTAAELAPLVGKTITSVTYFYSPAASAATASRLVTVSFASTTKTNFATTTDWILENQFTKVHESTVSLPGGIYNLVLPLQTPYVYTGGDLCVMSRRLMQTSYTSGVTSRVTTVTPANRAMYFQSDGTAFNFTNVGTRLSTVSNIAFGVMNSADNTGVITGVVSSLGVPQAGATVTLVGTSKVSTTNAAGVYSFIYVPVGTYEVTATKFGYFDKTETGIVVGDRLTTVRDITLTELPKVTVSGKVKASDTDAGLEGAVVKLAGFQAYEATTNATGDYSIPGVYADKTYTVNITHPRFYPYNGDLVVAGVNATLNVTLNEIPKPTYGVTATDITTAAKIDWKDPSTAQPKSYILDDGSSENGWAINPSANAWIGNWFKTTDAGIIKSVDIYGQVNVASGPRTVTVDIFNAAQVLVGSSAPFTIPADQWINVPLPDVAYTGDFYAMVQWPATVNNTNYIGFDQTGPNANLNLDMYRTAAGAWSVLHIAASSAAGVMMIRTNAELTSGKGAEYGYANVGKVSNAEVTTFDGYASNQSSKFSEPTSQEPPSSKSIMGYNVYRGLETAPVGTWAKLNGATISGITYNDTNFPTLPQGVYKYGVEVIYTGNNLSPWALSNTLPKDMISNVTINVTTNLPGTDANGATVVMAHEDGLAIHRYNGVIAGGTVNFPTVWKGNYTITITKAVFDVINANVLVTNATHTFTYQLLEKLNVPTGLVLTQLARTDYNLKWTDIAAPIVNIEDNFEAHTAFTINSASTKGWSYIDGDGSTTYGFSGITFPGGMTPMAYIIFKPSATTPDMNATAGIQPFSGQQFNACFAADVVMPNNDWFISPELSFAGQFTFSFYAKTYMSDYGLERFKVRYSTTGNAQANFTNYLAGTASTWVEAPVAAWTKYTYTVPSTAKYVAIQCVSNDAFVFMIDDIFIGTAGKDDPKAFLSYNVYLDGTKVSTAQVQSEYNYLNVPVGAHVAGVSHNYTTGESALATINFRVYPDAYCFSPRNLVITQAFAGNTLNWQLETNAYSTDIGGAVYNVYKDGVMIAPGLTTLTYFDACNSYAPATYTVERVCTGGVICPVPVTTTVANRMLTVPAYEPFSAATPANWINVRTAGTGTGTFQFLTAGTTPPATPKAGTHLASYNCYSYSAGTQGILVTPYIDGMKAGTIIDFWVYRDGTNYLTDADLLRIHANNRNDLTGATLLGTINRSISLAPVVAATGWYQYQFTAPADGRNFFIIEGRSAYGNNLHFDEITIFNYVDVIATAGPNGAIAPAGTTTIVQGTNMTLTATPDAGYHVSSILVNGEPFTFNKNPESSAPVAFTLNNIRVNTTVHVEFELNYYTLNPNNIIGAGATLTLNPDPVYHGGNATINIAVDCHTITGVIINGVNLGAITTYNFNNVVEPLPVIEIVTTIISYNILATPPQGQQVGGYITPAGVVPVDCGSAQTFTIVRNPGYRPNALWVDGVRVNIPANRKYTFTDVRAPHTINVEFEVFPQVLIYFSSNEGGRVIADDFETAVGFISLDSGTVAQRFTIVPDANYEIHAVYVDGVLNVSASVSGQYVFTNIIVNHTITAEFKKKNFTITATSGINGTITPSGLVSVPAYNNKLFIFNPATGYIIDKVLVDNVANVQAVADGQYEFTNVTANHTIAVTYKKDTYYIVAQCGLGGTITPQGNIPVLYNEHHAFTFAANVGYKVAVLTIDGVSHPELIALGAYTFYYVTTGHTIYVTFEKITYPVTASAGANGYISDPGTIYVPHGNNKSYSFTAANGYKIDKVYVDGVANAGAATTGLYTFSNVTAAHTISVSFIADAYTIVSSATAGGTISPVGNVVVANGANRTFSFNATPGNRLVKVKVDGIENAPAMVDGYYTFINVTANHTIEAIFAPIPVYSINATATTGGTITPAGNIQVTEGGTANFTFAAATFNKLTKVLVDGLEDALALQNGYFTFTNVFANHTIQAVFQSTITINENDYSSFIVSSERNVITITNKDLVPVEQVDIMDMFGRVIWAGNISDITTNITLQVATGVYAVRIITTDNVVLTTKVQILN